MQESFLPELILPSSKRQANGGQMVIDSGQYRMHYKMCFNLEEILQHVMHINLTLILLKVRPSIYISYFQINYHFIHSPLTLNVVAYF